MKKKKLATPDLADVARWFGADRWDRLEKQAAIVRGWNGETFCDVASQRLELYLVTHEAGEAVKQTALHLIRALGGKPGAEDLGRKV